MKIVILKKRRREEEELFRPLYSGRSNPLPSKMLFRSGLFRANRQVVHMHKNIGKAHQR